MFAAWYVFPFHPDCECVYIMSVSVRSSIYIWFWAKVTNWPSESATLTDSPSRTKTSEPLPLMTVPGTKKKKKNIFHIDQLVGGVLIGLTLKTSSWRSPQWKLRSSDLQHSAAPPVAVIMNRWKMDRLAAVSQCVYMTLERIDLLCCSVWNWPLKHTMSHSDSNATT